jgi:hypothetical protein
MWTQTAIVERNGVTYIVKAVLGGTAKILGKLGKLSHSSKGNVKMKVIPSKELEAQIVARIRAIVSDSSSQNADVRKVAS